MVNMRKPKPRKQRRNTRHGSDLSPRKTSESKARHSRRKPVLLPESAEPGNSSIPAASGGVLPPIEAIHGHGGVDLTEKVKDLVRLAKEQGHLTYEEVNDALPDDIITPVDLDQVLTKLRALEIEVIDPAEVERGRRADSDDEEESSRFDILDDPVRMYLRQMGKVPLLTREQEVEICKRIEVAEVQVRRIVYRFGFSAKEHI